MRGKAKRCPNCGKDFTPNWNTRKYCSAECARDYRNARRREEYWEVRR